jgi:hypothetical protein
MGRESTETRKIQEALMKALDDPDYFSHVALTKMLESVVPLMTKYELTRLLDSIGLEPFDLDIEV